MHVYFEIRFVLMYLGYRTREWWDERKSSRSQQGKYRERWHHRGHCGDMRPSPYDIKTHCLSRGDMYTSVEMVLVVLDWLSYTCYVDFVECWFYKINIYFIKSTCWFYIIIMLILWNSCWFYKINIRQNRHNIYVIRCISCRHNLCYNSCERQSRNYHDGITSLNACPVDAFCSSNFYSKYGQYQLVITCSSMNAISGLSVCTGYRCNSTFWRT